MKLSIILNIIHLNGLINNVGQKSRSNEKRVDYNGLNFTCLINLFTRTFISYYLTEYALRFGVHMKLKLFINGK